MENIRRLGIVCATYEDFICVYDERGLIFLFGKKDNSYKFSRGEIVIFDTIVSNNWEMPDRYVYSLKDSNFQIETVWAHYVIKGVFDEGHRTTPIETILINLERLNEFKIDIWTQESFLKYYSDIESQIKEMDINKILGSLKIELKESHIKKLGDDDSYYVWESTTIDTDDPYIKSLFNIGDKFLYSETAFWPWQKLKEESGYTDDDFGLNKSKMRRAIAKAKKNYSLSAHHRTLLSLKLYDQMKKEKQRIELKIEKEKYWPTSKYESILSSYNDESVTGFVNQFNGVIWQKNLRIYSSYQLDVYEKLYEDIPDYYSVVGLKNEPNIESEENDIFEMLDLLF